MSMDSLGKKIRSKPALIVLIALASGSIALAMMHSRMVQLLDDAIYDRIYDLRRPRDGTDSPVVIIAADEISLHKMAMGERHWAWPWPRQFWGQALQYVQDCGARAAGVDLIFPEPSQYNGELGDDKTFADSLDGLKMPVVYAKVWNSDGSTTGFAPPVRKPVKFGTVNFGDAATVRQYLSFYHNEPSLAVQVVKSMGNSLPPWAYEPFHLHFYGPHLDRSGKSTFRYLGAADVFEAMQDPEHAAQHGVDPSVFKNKIVLFGTTATGASDLKASPVDNQFPGVEVNATAIENLLKYQRVQVIPEGGIIVLTFLAALAAALGAMLPRGIWLKLLLPLIIIIAIDVAMVLLFQRQNMVWLPPVSPLTAIVLSVVLSLSWSYFAEDRQARFLIKALGQYVSPHVAAELKSDPKKLSISTEKRELTILFSDIAGFTEYSEKLDERIGPLLNYYLDEMSQPVLDQDGTLDKYIGDAVMSFWNAPIIQTDHAARACRTALAMQKRLIEIQPQLAELGAPGLSARVGINTGTCAFGNMGSRAKFNYSVIGDPCNFASRLEGAGKIYGTRILIGEATAKQVRDGFVLRKIDMLRVKGKYKPVTIYELIAEGQATPEQSALITHYETALAHYCTGDWDSAEKLLLDILAAQPNDGPSGELLSRVGIFRHNPPPTPWDGVYVAKEK
jgi:adenylate cyclase